MLWQNCMDVQARMSLRLFAYVRSTFSTWAGSIIFHHGFAALKEKNPSAADDTLFKVCHFLGILLYRK